MNGNIYEPPYLATGSILLTSIGAIGSVVNAGGIAVSMLMDTKRMNVFSKFILNVQVCFEDHQNF